MKHRTNVLNSALYLGLSAFYLLVALNYPIHIYANAPHDDTYFATCARNIVAGEWLGPYSYMRLIKGPGYALFLALTHISGLPLALTTSLLHLSACAAAVWVLHKAGLRGIWAVLLYFILLFQPANFPDRIIRDYFCNSLAIFSIAGILYVLIEKQASYWKTGFFGLMCGFFLITREDPHWLILPIVFLVLYKTVYIIIKRENIKRTILCFFCYFCCSIIPFLSISAINSKVYGVFAVTDITDRYFKKSLQYLYSINVGQNMYRIPVSREKMNIITKLSPSFERIITQTDHPWLKFDNTMQDNNKAEFEADQFMWFIREMVSEAGFYKNYNKSNEFYNQLSEELEKVCIEKKIECNINIIPFMPKIPIDSWKRAPEELNKFIKIFIYIDIINALKQKKYQNNDYNLYLKNINIDQLFLSNFFGITHYYGGSNMQVSGHYYADDKSWFSVRCGDAVLIPQRKQSLLVMMLMQSTDPVMSYFQFNVDDPASCTVVFDDTGVKDATLTKLQDFFKQSPLRMLLKFEKKQYNAGLGWGIGVKEKLYPLFGMLNIALFCFGSLAFCINILFSLRKRFLFVSIFAESGLWGAFYARLILLFLVSISSFPAAHSHYMLPMWPFMTMAAVLSLHTSWRIYQSRPGIQSETAP